MIDPTSAREPIKRLGTFLADVTMDRPAARIHADIIERLRTAPEPDPQLSGVYLDEKDFTAVWTAIRGGAALPASSWDTVVLPVIAHFSTRETAKGNLQNAIHLWNTARTAVSSVINAPPDQPQHIVPGFDYPTQDSLETLALPDTPAPLPLPAPPPRRPRGSAQRRFRLVAASVITVLVLVGALIAANSAGRRDTGAQTPPTQPTTGAPSPSTSPSAVPSAEPSGSPLAPGAPQGLNVTTITTTTISLAWQADTAVDHYRVFYGTASSGELGATSMTVQGLRPNTTYTFAVRAYTVEGLESPPSSPVSAITDAAPKLTITPASPLRNNTNFFVKGSDWPCTSNATAEIRLDGLLVARATVSNGTFSAELVPIVDVGSDPRSRLRSVDDTDEVELRGSMTFRVTLPPQSQCRSVSAQTMPVIFNSQ